MAKKKATEGGILAELQSKFGEEVVTNLSKNQAVKCESVTTGTISVDDIVGVDGWPKGRIIEISGPESSGKTTLALHAVAAFQNSDDKRKTGYIDVEHAIDPLYASNLGVKLEDMIFSQPNSAEEALTITEMMANSSEVGMIIVDSVAALTPQAEIDGEIGDRTVALQAQLMSKALRRLVPIVKEKNVIVIFINQVRDKISFMSSPGAETTPGGRALKFYSSVRVDIRRIGGVKEGDKIIGNTTKIKITKNKVAMPFRTAEVTIIFGKGIQREREILDIGTKMKLISRSGSWYNYNDQRIGNGLADATETLVNNKELTNEIETKIRELITEKKKDQVILDQEPEDDEENEDEVITESEG